MTLVLFIIIFSILIELLIILRPINKIRLRQVLLSITVLLISFTATCLILFNFTLFTFLFAVVCIYRIVNLLRFAANRINQKYLHRVTIKTSVYLFVIQLSISLVWFADKHISIVSDYWVLALSVSQIVIAIVFCATTLRRMYKTRMIPITEHLLDSKLPSITVAVPARNETDELETCIQALICSNYPKLEIIVLDDCSQSRKTPEIIKSFAHAGVRFVQGEEPHSTWFAKNHAYAQLASEASGEIIIFIGVDVLVKPNTITELIETMLKRKKRMLSIIPNRSKPGQFQISLSQSIRYMWELSPPRKLFKRPPVLSSCWLIYKDDLQKYGGFAAVSRMVVPEVYFAKIESNISDGYSLLRSNDYLGLTSGKSLASQRETAIRVRYPSLHRKPEMVLIMSALELSIIAGSYIFAFLGVFNIVPNTIFVISLVAASMFTFLYAVIAISTRVNSWFIAPFLSLPAVLFDVCLMHVSMFRYEFAEVTWKGRNVCVPVMHRINKNNDLLTIEDLGKLP